MDKKQQAMINDKIRVLLSSTNLTFKQIRESFKKEDDILISSSLIRKVNKDYRYRKRRYDSKLSFDQKKELSKEFEKTLKPNFTLLAKKYGVCHGSIWYWWRKNLSIKAERKNDNIVEFAYYNEIDDPLNLNDATNDLSFIGNVLARDIYGDYIKLPILMFSSSKSSVD